MRGADAFVGSGTRPAPAVDLLVEEGCGHRVQPERLVEPDDRKPSVAERLEGRGVDPRVLGAAAQLVLPVAREDRGICWWSPTAIACSWSRRGAPARTAAGRLSCEASSITSRSKCFRDQSIGLPTPWSSRCTPDGTAAITARSCSRHSRRSSRSIASTPSGAAAGDDCSVKSRNRAAPRPGPRWPAPDRVAPACSRASGARPRRRCPRRTYWAGWWRRGIPEGSRRSHGPPTSVEDCLMRPGRTGVVVRERRTPVGLGRR